MPARSSSARSRIFPVHPKFIGYLFLALAPCALPALRAQVQVSVIAATGQQAPTTTTGSVFDTFYAPAINDSGTVAYSATLSGGPVSASSDNGIWIATGATTVLAVREGEVPPGSPGGAEYEEFLLPSLNTGGQLVFQATLRGFASSATLNSGVFSRSTAPAISLVARAGVAAVGANVGENYDLFDFVAPIGLSDDGETGFNVSFTSGGGIYRGIAGGLSLLARNGTAAPAGTFTTFSASDLNSGGTMIFAANTNFPSGASGIWTMAPAGGAVLIARENQSVPGLGALSGITYHLLSDPTISDDGRICFFASLNGSSVDLTNNRVLMSSRTGTLTRLFRTGDIAPGTRSDFEDFTAAGINSKGDVALRGALTGLGVDASNRVGLWLVDEDGSHLLLRAGRSVDLGSLGTKVLSDIQLSSQGLNNEGQVAVAAKFTDMTEAILRLEILKDVAPPSVRITGKRKRVTSAGSITVRGTASDDRGIARVEWKKLGENKTHLAAGKNAWRLKVKLKSPKTRIQVRAVDTSGKTSPFAKMTIVRK